MNHWIIAPVIVPVVLAGLILLLARDNLVVQRTFAVVGALVLAGVAVTKWPRSW